MSRMSNKSEIICPITEVTSEIFEKILKKIDKEDYALVIEDGNYVAINIIPEGLSDPGDYDYITGQSYKNFIILAKKYLKKAHACDNLDDYEYNNLMARAPGPNMTLREYLSSEIAQEVYDRAINVNKEGWTADFSKKPIHVLKYEKYSKKLYVKRYRGEGVLYDYVRSL